MRRRRVPFRELIWRLSRGQVILVVCWLLAAEAVTLWWRQDYKRQHEILMETRADSFLVLHAKEVVDQIKEDRSVKADRDIDATPMASDVRNRNLKTMLMPAAGIMVVIVLFVWEWGITGRHLRRNRALGNVLSMDASSPRNDHDGRHAGLFGRLRRRLGFRSSHRRRRRTPRS